MISDAYHKKHESRDEKMSLQMWSDFHNKEVGVFLCPDQWEVRQASAVSQGNPFIKN